jgi:putative tricarboxylic transport membrane protein
MNRVGGLIVFCLGMYILFQDRKLAFGKLHAPGPGFFPAIIAIALMALSLFLVIPSTKKTDGITRFSLRLNGGMTTAFGTLIVYFLTLEYLGFLIAGFLFMGFLFKVISSMKWYGAALWSLVSIGLTYVIFGVFLRIPLPQGILGFIGF